MTSNFLRLLDIDEGSRDYYGFLHKEVLEICKKYNLILDLATSDINVWILGTNDESKIEEIRKCYGEEAQYFKEEYETWTIL